MAKLKIYTFPEKVLAEKAVPITHVDKSWHKVADDMLETMYDAPGIGLAANQVGLLNRIIVVDTEYRSEHEDQESFPEANQGETDAGLLVHRKPQILINPEIIHREGKIIYCEGCLSVPEYSADVERSAKIKVEYKTIDGLTKTLDAEGLLAVCLQHEIDHLNGKLFIDRLSTVKSQVAKRKLLKK